MKTHLLILGTAALLGTSFVATSYAVDPSEYLHLIRHRDAAGNLLMAPTMPQAESSVMKKMVMPSQLKTFERRSTDWGMSEEAVKANEPVQSKWSLQAPVLAEYEKRIAYHTQIEGIEADLTYTFYDNQLGQAKYVFEPKHDDAVAYVQDFHTVEHWITHSYGPPLSVQEIWLDPLYQYDSSLWGLAIKRGHLVMVAEWKNPGTDIVLVLDGGNDEVGLVADFSSTTYVVPVSFNQLGEETILEPTLDTETSVTEKAMEYSLPEGEPMEGMHIRPASEPVESMIVEPPAAQEFGDMSKNAVISTFAESERMLQESSIHQQQVLDVHPTEDHGGQHSMEEHAHDHLMEDETELKPHHL